MNSILNNKKAKSHQRIVVAASKKLRRLGLQGVAVADVMKEAGLTHGGFYSHFASRNALLAEALVFASKDIGARIQANVSALSQNGQSRFTAFVETYLSESQISDCENGCPVAAVGNELPMQTGEALDSAQQIVHNLHRLVKQAMETGASDADAWSVASGLIGAMQLARALGDNDQGRAVLAAARDDLIKRYEN